MKKSSYYVKCSLSLSHTYLDVDVYLRTRVQLGHHSSFKCLLQVEAHLGRLAVTMRPPLPLCCAEGGHAVLTVDDRSIVKSPAARTSHLGGTSMTCLKAFNNSVKIASYNMLSIIYIFSVVTLLSRPINPVQSNINSVQL